MSSDGVSNLFHRVPSFGASESMTICDGSYIKQPEVVNHRDHALPRLLRLGECGMHGLLRSPSWPRRDGRVHTGYACRAQERWMCDGGDARELPRRALRARAARRRTAALALRSLQQTARRPGGACAAYRGRMLTGRAPTVGPDRLCFQRKERE